MPTTRMQDAGGPAQGAADLEGRVAVVLGSAYGIGRAIVEELMSRGARVVCADINPRAEAFAAELRAAGRDAVYRQLDLRDEGSIRDLFAFVRSSYERLDIAVNNAAAPRSTKPFLDLDLSEWDMNMAINARGTFIAMQEEGRLMADGGRGGRIVNIATVAALRPYAERAHYGASKGVVLTLTRSAALELAEFGVTVNAVAPGPVDTEQSQAARAGGNSDADGERLTALFAATPVGRIGEPLDIARMVGFLASPASSFITGSIVTVDGGMAIR